MNFKAKIVKGNIKQIEYNGGMEYIVNTKRYYTMESLSEESLREDKVEENCKHIHGLSIWESKDFIRIYNDPFCSHPVYIFSLQRDELIVTTQFSDIYTRALDLNVDYCGIYELLWLGGILYDRTIYREVKQLPAASYCEIEKNTMKYKIDTYWNFEIFENKNIKSQQEADVTVYQKLKEIFSQYQNKHILMGLSGGMDSRLAACMLSNYSNKNQMIFFTFGYNKYILEYYYAKKVTKRLKLSQPLFIKLTQKDYESAKILALRTGCHVGMNHGHIYECLKRIKSSKNSTFISNYYSDAVMGWDARKEKVYERFEELELYQKICRNKDKLPQKIAEEIIEEVLCDLKKIYNRYNSKSNFSCFEEFYYVVERNPKFHLRSAYQCNDVVKTDIPFADFDLLKLCISIPLKYRWEKKLEKEIISNYYFTEKDISSRRYFERSKIGEEEYSIGEKMYYMFGVIFLRGLNLLNLILEKVSGGRVQIINPYQTENQRIVFDRYFEDEFFEALGNLKKLEIISEQEYKRLNGKQFKSDKLGLKFAIIDLWNSIKHTRMAV